VSRNGSTDLHAKKRPPLSTASLEAAEELSSKQPFYKSVLNPKAG